NNSVHSIRGELFVTDNPDVFTGLSILELHNEADTKARRVSMSIPGAVVGLAPATISFNPDSTRLTVDGGRGGSDVLFSDGNHNASTRKLRGNSSVDVFSTTGALDINTESTAFPDGSVLKGQTAINVFSAGIEGFVKIRGDGNLLGVNTLNVLE